MASSASSRYGILLSHRRQNEGGKAKRRVALLTDADTSRPKAMLSLDIRRVLNPSLPSQRLMVL
jgi:hypothetical protein